jgi:DNA topoisomerase I
LRVRPGGNDVVVARAGDAGLRYVSDDEPGLTRVRAGRGFGYRDRRGRRITSETTLSRIKALAIPPAWTDVWICADPKGHLQAVGRDARGRKQYRYHDGWRAQQEQEKYERLIDFGDALPGIRRAIAKDLARTGLDHERVVATIVHLLEVTLIRVGNEQYARDNSSYGLTTLRDRQVRIDGSDLRFVFTGKSGQRHDIELSDRRVARIVRGCQELPGQRLFQYEDDQGQIRPVGSADVNEYLRVASGGDFTAKDFRTWMGTLYTAAALASIDLPDDDRAVKKLAKTTIAVVARQLGNTPTVARNSYVHPDVIDLFTDGSLARVWAGGPSRPTRWMIVEERKLATVLRAARRRQSRAARHAA